MAQAIGMDNAPHPTDILVGAKTRFYRHLAGITQADLGTAVGCKFQQIQKYETGANRVSASRLMMIARVLNVPIAHFFDEAAPLIDADAAKLAGRIGRLDADRRAAIERILRAVEGA